jgi:biotin-(acetyl-CoA carboxylase) ligase
MTLSFDPTMPGEGDTPTFPPLLRGIEVKAGVDPFAKAVSDAGRGVAEVGDLYWSPDKTILQAAIVFAPDEPLHEAAPILFAVANGLNDCIGALAPPEVGVQHVWPDGVKVNGAWCGALRVDASTRDPAEVPEWLIVGISLSVRWDASASNPGESPDLTALSEEGCGHLSAVRLLESWSRHTLTWVNRWEDGELRAITDGWLNRAEGRGETVAFEHNGITQRGTFLGLDEAGGMILKTETGSDSLPLMRILDAPRIWPPEMIV